MVPVIIDIPEEAIVVLIDVSGSMDDLFYDCKDMTRLGAVKAFFGAFADRSMAYKLKTAVSLAFFDDQYLLQCGFTESWFQFKELVNQAESRGSTSLYDALQNAAH